MTANEHRGDRGSIHMRYTRRVGSFVVGLVLGVIAIWAAQPLLFGSGGSPVQVAPRQAAQPLVGQEYAESLGLPRVDSPGACTHVAEAPPDGFMYCLDSVVSNDREADMVAKRVTGHMPTTLDEQLFDLNAELSALPHTAEGEARANELVEQIAAVLQQREAEREG
jgi:hypothetical protein